MGRAWKIVATVGLISLLAAGLMVPGLALVLCVATFVVALLLTLVAPFTKRDLKPGKFWQAVHDLFWGI